MNIKSIKSEADYDAALTAINGLMGAALDTTESDELEVLVALVEAYEAGCWPVEAPDPIAEIEHIMEAPRLPAEGPRHSDRVPTTRFGSAQPSPAPYLADDPAPVS